MRLSITLLCLSFFSSFAYADEIKKEIIDEIMRSYPGHLYDTSAFNDILSVYRRYVDDCSTDFGRFSCRAENEWLNRYAIDEYIEEFYNNLKNDVVENLKTMPYHKLLALHNAIQMYDSGIINFNDLIPNGIDYKRRRACFLYTSMYQNTDFVTQYESMAAYLKKHIDAFECLEDVVPG